MNSMWRTTLASLFTFAPILFDGISFAMRFSRAIVPDIDFGANIAGAMLGGFAECTSMLVGFR